MLNFQKQPRYSKCMLATVCIPWDVKYNFDEAIFRKHLRHIVEQGTRDLYIFGTAGEGYAVDEKNFDKISGVFAEEMSAAGGSPMVGVINQSLQTVVSRIKRCMGNGIKLFQISLPSWGACSFDEIRSFFGETCGRFPEASFLYYNTVRSHRIINGEEFALLAEEFPNFVATKNSNDSLFFIASLFNSAPQLRHFLTEASFAVASQMNFDAGLLVSVSSINWKITKAFYKACCERKYEEMAGFTNYIFVIWNIVVPFLKKEGHMDGVFDKVYSKILDRDFPLRLIPPYTYADDKVFNEFLSIVKEKAPEWLAN